MSDLEVVDLLESLGFTRYFSGTIREWKVLGTYHMNGFSVEVSNNADELITIRLYKGSVDVDQIADRHEKWWFVNDEPFLGRYFADVTPDKVRNILERIARGEFCDGKLSRELSAAEHERLLTANA